MHNEISCYRANVMTVFLSVYHVEPLLLMDFNGGDLVLLHRGWVLELILAHVFCEFLNFL